MCMNSTLHPRGAYHFGVAPAVVLEHPNPYRGLKGSCACDLNEIADHINYYIYSMETLNWWLHYVLDFHNHAYIADYMESFAVVFKNIKNNDLEFQLVPAWKYSHIFPEY